MVSEEQILQALYTASGIGAVIGLPGLHRRRRRRLSGGDRHRLRHGGGALVSIQGGTAAQIGHAAAMALKNLLGLVCDPVAGLVEVPCVKRNVVGTVNAVSCADMALAGIDEPRARWMRSSTAWGRWGAVFPWNCGKPHWVVWRQHPPERP